MSGDVKYHLGTSYNRPTSNGKMVHLSLMANPSHLEVRAFNESMSTTTKPLSPRLSTSSYSCTFPTLVVNSGSISCCP